MADSDPLPPTVTMPADLSTSGLGEYVGQTLDNRYHLERLIGRGGMGSVYLARHVAIGRRLAVKILDSRRLEDGQGFKRLFREAQTAAGIGHPNIVEVVDVGTTLRGDPYLVMEYLVGEDLASFMARRGPVPVAIAVTVLEPILLALGAAHARGIVHRDIKPSNIFLVRREDSPPDVKLIDFGVAKVLGPTTDGKITMTGALLGTPSYMSPEQAVGMEELDARVDLYAVGIIFYELVTGELPFHGANYNELLYRIVRDEVPTPKTPDGDLPESVRSVIETATRKIASDRYQSSAEMLEAFRDLDAWTGRDLALTELGNTIRPSIPDTDTSSNLVRASDRGTPTSARTKLSSKDSTRADRARVVSGTLATATTRAADAPVRSRAGLAVALGALATAGLVAALFLGLARPPTATDASATTAPDATAPDLEGIQITIEGAPKGARVYYDRTPVETQKFRVRRSRLVTPVRVELDGHEPFVTSVVPLEDTVVRVEFEPQPTASGAAGAPASAAGRAATKPSPPPRATKPSSNSGLGKLGRDTYYTEEFE